MLRIGAAQTAPVFLDRQATTERAISWIERAADEGLDLVAFGETFLPGYPFWLSHTDGASFDSPVQADAFARYVAAAVTLDGPELAAIAEVVRARDVFAIVGIVERATSGGSVYASLVPVCPQRGVLFAHRKLVPTLEERLVWARGDGHGLRTFDVKGVTVSALNCWENWMPQARHALYAQGAQLHVALWPGSVGLTRDVTRFVALEGRQFVLSAGSLLRRSDLPDDVAGMTGLPDSGWEKDGGSAIAGPDGGWLAEPVAGEERLVIADIDIDDVRRARRTFDPTAHYSRPDIFTVDVDRRRQGAARFTDDD